MKALLAKLPCRQALGLYIGEGEISLSRVAATLAGPLEIARTTLPCPPDQQDAMLQTLLGPLDKTKKRLPLAFGFPGQQAFFSTRPIRTSDDSATPQVLLHEVLQSPNIAIDDMVVDLIRAQPENRKVASIVACRKKYFHRLLGDVVKQPIRIALAEPAPCALLRLAASRHPAPRRAKTVIRIFLGRGKGIAVAVAGQLPLIWRSFEVNDNDANGMIQAQVRALESLLVYCGIESAPGAILVHGRLELRDQLQSDNFIRKITAKLQWTDGPCLDAANIAHGLALGAANPEHDGFDLARSLKPPLSFREMLPWKEIAAQIAIFLGVGLFFYLKAEDLDDKYRAAHADIQRRPWQEGVDERELQKEKKDLKLHVDAVQKFLGSRVNWTSFTKEIIDRLPENASLHTIHGLREFSTDSSKPGANSLMVRGTIPIASEGRIPAELDSYLAELRTNSIMQRDYPLVDLAELRWTQPIERGARPVATFSIMCLPKPKERKQESAGDNSSASKP